MWLRDNRTGEVGPEGPILSVRTDGDSGGGGDDDDDDDDTGGKDATTAEVLAAVITPETVFTAVPSVAIVLSWTVLPPLSPA